MPGSSPLQGAQPLYGAAETRALEARCRERLGIPTRVLMECAGAAVARAAAALRGERRDGWGGEARPAGPVVVLAGKGQNGGDGLVAARHLAAMGVPVRVLGVGEVGSGGDARPNRAALEGAGVPVEPWDGSSPELLRGASVIVDSLLGTGARPPIEGSLAEAIAAIQGAGRPVVAVDVPSGLDADRGVPLGPCVRATRTVTLVAAKPGLYLEPGRSFAGEVEVEPIGVPVASLPPGPSLWRLTPDAVLPLLPARPPAGHKGTFGHLVVCAGSSGYEGAALLTAIAGLRAGAGLVTLLAPEPVAERLAGRAPEVMVRGLPAAPGGSFDSAAAALAGRFGARAAAVAVGPGLGEGGAPFARELLPLLAQEAHAAGRPPLPVVLDADGLRAFAGDLEGLRGLRLDLVLTPHPGEMAALLGEPVEEVRADRVDAARRAAGAAGATVVHKGAPAVVATAEGVAYLNGTGNVALATAGAGDVLTGLIGALLANGLPGPSAACLGAFLHGLAGDLLRARRGDAGVLAGDVADRLPAARRALLRGRGLGPPGVERGGRRGPRRGSARVGEREWRGL